MVAFCPLRIVRCVHSEVWCRLKNSRCTYKYTSNTFKTKLNYIVVDILQLCRLTSEISQKKPSSTFRVEGVGSKMALSRWVWGCSLVISAGCKVYGQRKPWKMDRIYGKIMVNRERKIWETKITRSLKMRAEYSFEKSLSTYVNYRCRNPHVCKLTTPRSEHPKKRWFLKAFTRNSSTWYQLISRSLLSIQNRSQVYDPWRYSNCDSEAVIIAFTSVTHSKTSKIIHGTVSCTREWPKERIVLVLSRTVYVLN
jgi:hypothetical protein